MKEDRREILFKKIIEEHRDKIYRICYAYLYQKDLVDDLYQDVIIHIWNGLKNFKENAALTTWLYRVTLNVTISFNKKNKKQQQLFDRKIPDTISEYEDPVEIEKESRIHKLMQCVHQLKKDERIIISLVLEELSYKEIAEILGIEPNHVGVRINRIKKKLLKLYNND